MKKIIAFILLLPSVFAFADGNVNIEGHKFILVPFIGGIWQRSFFGDVGLAHAYDIYYVKNDWWHTTVAYSKIGAEVSAASKYELLAPKVSSEIDWKYFCLRGNIADYIEKGKSNFYFIPEIGFTLSGFITVAGGYNKMLEKKRAEIVPPFRISLSFLLPVSISHSIK